MTLPLTISVLNADQTKINKQILPNSQVLLKYPCDGTGNSCFPYQVIFSIGIYRIELYDASGGGNSSTTIGGKGSYTSGYIDFKTKTTMFFYIGQKGSPNGANTYNGGGHGVYFAQDQKYGGSGGGATDMRYVSGDWDNLQSLKSRIMVAAGGSGAQDHWTFIEGAHGGALTGNNGKQAVRPEYTNSSALDNAVGATQISGGKGGIGYEKVGGWPNSRGESGSFGKAGGQPNNQWGSGGGGGYYGGGAGALVTWLVGTGSSGSSFVSGYPNCNAIRPEYSLSNPVHSGSPNHYSGYVFKSLLCEVALNLFHLLRMILLCKKAIQVMDMLKLLSSNVVLLFLVFAL